MRLIKAPIMIVGMFLLSMIAIAGIVVYLMGAGSYVFGYSISLGVRMSDWYNKTVL